MRLRIYSSVIEVLGEVHSPPVHFPRFPTPSIFTMYKDEDSKMPDKREMKRMKKAKKLKKEKKTKKEKKEKKRKRKEKKEKEKKNTKLKRIDSEVRRNGDRPASPLFASAQKRKRR